jgi:hypothetical protein
MVDKKQRDWAEKHVAITKTVPVSNDGHGLSRAEEMRGPLGAKLREVRSEKF